MKKWLTEVPWYMVEKSKDVSLIARIESNIALADSKIVRADMSFGSERSVQGSWRTIRALREKGKAMNRSSRKFTGDKNVTGSRTCKKRYTQGTYYGR